MEKIAYRDQVPTAKQLEQIRRAHEYSEKLGSGNLRGKTLVAIGPNGETTKVPLIKQTVFQAILNGYAIAIEE